MAGRHLHFYSCLPDCRANQYTGKGMVGGNEEAFNFYFPDFNLRLKSLGNCGLLSFLITYERTMPSVVFAVFTEGGVTLFSHDSDIFHLRLPPPLSNLSLPRRSSSSTPKQDLVFQTKGWQSAAAEWDKPMVCFAEAYQESWWYRTVHRQLPLDMGWL